MILKYKNTSLDYELKKTNFKSGLKEGDFWINVDVHIKNDEMELRYIREAISYFELKDLTEKLIDFRSSEYKKKEHICLIKHFDEFELLPDGSMIHKFFSYDDVCKYYAIIYEEDELTWFIEKNSKFLEEQ